MANPDIVEQELLKIFENAKETGNESFFPFIIEDMRKTDAETKIMIYKFYQKEIKKLREENKKEKDEKEKLWEINKKLKDEIRELKKE